MAGKPLTKSRFTLAWDCPTKLYYRNHAEYADQSADDPFLRALADGGFQVGALARTHFPGGFLVDTLDTERAVSLTAERLAGEQTVVFEGAFRHGDCLVRADVVRKRGDFLELFEVKAKSWGGEEDGFFLKRPKGLGLTAEWLPYLMDVAFQTWVVRQAHPRWKVKPYLYLVDKTGLAETDRINQRFLLARDAGGRPRVEDRGTGSVGESLMTAVDATEAVEAILGYRGYGLVPGFDGGSLDFAGLVAALAEASLRDERLAVGPGQHCKGCEFTTDGTEPGKKSGFQECWRDKLSARPGATPVFQLWNFRTGSLFDEGKFFVEDLREADVNPQPPKDDRPGLSASQRQWIQVEKARKGDREPHFEPGLESEMARWRFPLHFIDFETTLVALPFNRGRRPYETIAFQFSHHVVREDGAVEHRGQYLDRERGRFPNFEFVRALRDELDRDQGTVFRYAQHENTVLVHIHRQLRASEEPDREELCAFLRTLTQSNGEEKWRGPRAMVDLCDLVKRYFYHPLTGGSNSIKKVLPALLATSEYLQERYSRPIYGSRIPSLNFRDKVWIERDGAGVKDPYQLLEPIFTDVDRRTLDLMTPDSELADGGAAMMAYARMQFTEMSETERDRLAAALLKYCELDTLAMVMLYEYWNDRLEVHARQAA